MNTNDLNTALYEKMTAEQDIAEKQNLLFFF